MFTPHQLQLYNDQLQLLQQQKLAAWHNSYNTAATQSAVTGLK